MEERYIEVNELTGPYLKSLRDPKAEDLKVLRGLVHDRKWWSRFKGESPREKLRMVRVTKGKGISKWELYLESETKLLESKTKL